MLDGEWERAAGTTLGADDGIGMAAALAALDLPADAPLPPLVAIFTTNEEQGHTGGWVLATASCCASVWACKQQRRRRIHATQQRRSPAVVMTRLQAPTG